ncbi:recombinase family protein [Nocardia abscessus]|uniref:recombinase family protein n=1 Tax=Nocardia abscessus TaxID=120957 RepID=UPI002454274F|nr:recombinase family protein [Nocardia abscessus]
MAGPAKTLRVLGRLRLSRSTEESTSIERQREIIQQWADANGHTIMGWAEDIDVSGSVDGFEAPQLGEWLNDRHPEWDVLVAWKLDRLGRNAIQLNKLFGWCLKHDKTLVSCSESIDLSTWAGRMLAGVIAGLAEGELEAIKERAKASRRKLRSVARWPGGKPAFGYRTVARTDGPGWGLEIDPVAYELIRRIVEDVLDGKSYTQLAAELNTEGIVTPAEYHRGVKAGVPTLKRSELPADVDLSSKTGRDRRWTQTPIRNMLASPALRGHAHHQGELIRDDSGMPVQFANPIVSLDEWELLQAELEGRKEKRVARREKTLSPLAGVLYCLECGSTLHHTRKIARGIEYRYYRCENKDIHDIRAEFVENLVEELVLDEIGDVEILERVWVPGDSKEADLREAITNVDELTKALGRASSATVRERIQNQLSALDARIVELEQAPARESRWEYRPTGGTYREAWESNDANGRRELLKRSAITCRIRLSGIEGKRSTDNAGTVSFEVLFPSELWTNLGHPKGEYPWRKVNGQIPAQFSRRSTIPDEFRVSEGRNQGVHT